MSARGDDAADGELAAASCAASSPMSARATAQSTAATRASRLVPVVNKRQVMICCRLAPRLVRLSSSITCSSASLAIADRASPAVVGRRGPLEIELAADSDEPRGDYRVRRQPRAVRDERLVVAEDG